MKIDTLDGAWHWILSAVLTPLVLALASMLGGWTPAMTTLVIIIMLDIVSGFARALVQQQLSSSISWRGMVKKVLILMIVALAYQADCLIGAGTVVRDATIIFFGVSEALSVLENAAASGLPVPEFLREALRQLNEKKARLPDEMPPGDPAAGAPA
jgi:toxin secretion/phage lysis holin